MKLQWDQVGQKDYEAGVDKGVLFIPDGTGAYINGYAWNGLTAVTEAPAGAATTKSYANNSLYLALTSLETFGFDIEAYTYPDQFAQCDGTQQPAAGVSVSQQPRKLFGLAYRTLVGNDLAGTAFGYKIHLVYGAVAAPSQKQFSSINESPAALAFKWTCTTTPVNVTGYKPTSLLVIDSTKVPAANLTALENLLYGTSGTSASLPTPDAVLALFAGSVTTVLAQNIAAPSYNGSTHVITIPTVTGVIYMINGAVVTGTVTITQDTVVNAVPDTVNHYAFPPVCDDDWYFHYV